VFLGLLFVLGMLITDGINGLWISRLIARADQLACIASRVMSLAVSGVSLLVAAFGATKLLVPTVGAWAEGREALLGASVVAAIALSFAAASHLARRPAAVRAATPQAPPLSRLT